MLTTDGRTFFCTDRDLLGDRGSVPSHSWVHGGFCYGVRRQEGESCSLSTCSSTLRDHSQFAKA